MAYDKNISPVGWYVVSYLLRFVELADKDNENPEKRFLAWENTVLVKARNLDEAYTKGAKIARAETKQYRGGPSGVPVRWIFEGVTTILPIYEKLADGAEIMWGEHAPRKLKTLRRMVKKKGDFAQ
ncbi:MAG: hypothetical protein JWN73_1308 [Betaproteobacteria bacterium]|nr:hypothetical protein [Betaproteobacteria bacterium]